MMVRAFRVRAKTAQGAEVRLSCVRGAQGQAEVRLELRMGKIVDNIAFDSPEQARRLFAEALTLLPPASNTPPEGMLI